MLHWIYPNSWVNFYDIPLVVPRGTHPCGPCEAHTLKLLLPRPLPARVPLLPRLFFRGFWNAPIQVFCSKQFVSEVNTLKVIAPSVLVARAEKSRHVQASDALEPLDPCSACTLRPPCQHISEKVCPKTRDSKYFV